MTYRISPSLLSADFARLGEEVRAIQAAGADLIHFEPVEALIPLFAKAGAGIITFHPEASRHVDRTLALIREHGCKAGIVFNPATPLEYMDYVMDRLDIVLMMSVNPGFGGQSFIPAVLPKITAVRKKLDAWKAQTGKDIWLEVDGGVKVDNIAKVAAVGADTFVAGSAVFGAPDADGGYQEVFNKLRAALG
jgi:ribulose-phosphate 3-epimerase